MLQQRKRIVAIVMCVIAYWCTRLPAISDADAARLATEFSFSKLPLPESPGEHRRERAVNADLQHISGWISSVGASVALGDLDNDGLPNDVCLVDPRTDEVFIAPVPGTGDRYAAFTLRFDREPQDSSRLRAHHPDSMAPTGCRFGDLNEDGFLDVLVYFWGRPPVAYLAHNRTGRDPLSRSMYRKVEVAESSDGWYTNTVTFADLNGDGHVDIVVGNYDRDGTPKMASTGDLSSVMQHSMSRAYNGGGNRFLLWQRPHKDAEDPILFVEQEPGLDTETMSGWTLAVGAADLDGDQLPEIYVANDFGPDHLLHNMSTLGQLHFQVLNGKKDFTSPNSKVLGRDSFKGMGVDFGQLNKSDAVPDILVSNIAGPMSLEESHFAFVSSVSDKQSLKDAMSAGVAPYRDESEMLGLSRSGWGWDIRFGDFNNDGVAEVVQATGFMKGAEDPSQAMDRWPELHEAAIGNDELLSNPANWPRFRAIDHDELSGHEANPFFVLSGGRYYDISKQLGLDAPYVTRGIATADCDGDGDLDFAIANQWERSWFFRNDLIPSPESTGAKASSAKLRPALILNLLLPVDPTDPKHQTLPENKSGAIIGSPAIGAAATIGVIRNMDGKLRGADGTIWTSQVDGGNGHSGQRSPQLHFGLGDDQAFPGLVEVMVELKWRDRNGRLCMTNKTLKPGTHTIFLNPENLAGEQ